MSKEKVVTFIENLNGIIAGREALENKQLGRFVLHTINMINRVQVSVLYKENNKHHLIFDKSLNIENFEGDQADIVNSFYQQAYLELLRMSILLEDSVGNFKDAVTQLPIDVLSFKTLITEGLEKLTHKTT